MEVGPCFFVFEHQLKIGKDNSTKQKLDRKLFFVLRMLKMVGVEGKKLKVSKKRRYRYNTYKSTQICVGPISFLEVISNFEFIRVFWLIRIIRANPKIVIFFGFMSDQNKEKVLFKNQILRS